MDRRIPYYLIILVLFLLYVSLTFNTWIVWYNYASSELFNYLFITPIILLIIYFYITDKIILFIDKLNIIVFLILITTSIYLYVYAPYTQYIDQYLVAGSVIAGIAILSLFLHIERVVKRITYVLILILLGLLLIPVPVGIVFDVSAYLTRYILDYSIPLAKIMGTRLETFERGGLVIVRVFYRNSFYDYHIAPICSGIIGMFSVLAVAPLLLAVAFTGSKRLIFRIIGGAVSIVLLAVLMFATNILRLALVFYTTSVFGKEIGYGLFHYSSEIILILPIAYLVIKLLVLFVGKYSFTIRFPKITYPNPQSTLLHIIVVFTALSLLAPIAYSYDYSNPSTFFVNLDNGPPKLFNVGNGTVSNFIPDRFDDVVFTYYGRIKAWEKTLDPSTRIHMFRSILGNGTRNIDIYVEFSNRGSGIHVWEICLPWQNMSVYNTSWVILRSRDGSILRQVWFLKYGKGMLHGALFYWRDKVYSGSGVKYFRLTIMINNYIGRNVTEKEVSLIYRLTYMLWLKSLDASYSIHGTRSVGFEYLKPSIAIIVVLAILVLFRDRMYVLIKKVYSIQRIR